jgi:superfamily II DNA or RNA helicase
VGYGEVVVGSTPKTERERIFGDMREGKIKLIISTYSLAKEGLDLPILDRLYLATPHKDYAIVKQSAGRIERNIRDKKQPIILDFVDKNIYYCEKAYRQRKKILSKRY